MVVLLVVSFYLLSQSNYHTERNKHNVLPEGLLTPSGDKEYTDEAGRIWLLEPQIKNTFHQPDIAVPAVKDPYPNVVEGLKYDPETPNYKFLSEQEEGSGSYEAILQPDGTYLTEGPKQGTFNYGHPIGLWGMVKHTILDVIPHFFNKEYSI